MNEEQTKLALQLAGWARHRGVDIYRPGMLVTDRFYSDRLTHMDDQARGWYVHRGDWKPREELGHPVITDAATVGCLLDILQGLPGVCWVDTEDFGRYKNLSTSYRYACWVGGTKKVDATIYHPGEGVILGEAVGRALLNTLRCSPENSQ